MDESSGKQMRCHDVIINQPGLNQRIYGDVSKDQVFHGHTIGHDGEVVTTSNPWVIYETSLGVSTKKTSDVSWNAFGRFTQCRHHQSGNVPRKHLPKPTTGTHPRRLQTSPCSFCGDFFIQRTFNGSKENKNPPVPHVRFLPKRRPSHIFCQVLLKPSHCLLLGKLKNPRWEFLLPQQKPIPKSNKRKLHMTWVSKQEFYVFQETSFFFRVLGVGLLRGCNLKVWDSLRLKTPYHLGDLDFLGLRFLLFLRAKDL